jgi:hypothetical protein
MIMEVASAGHDHEGWPVAVREWVVVEVLFALTFRLV